MHGRSKGHDLDDGTHTRVKIDLFPEYIRNLPPQKRALWDVVGRALCSDKVRQAFIRRLAPGLQKRFGEDYAKVGMYPIPILTRDIPGYLITPHTDTRWKGITVQLYLPADDANTDIGTIFHDMLADGSMPKKTQMRFAPNTGYAFAVGSDTWHSADPVHNRVKTRDSILLTYFVDQGLLKVLRNRGKRLGNFLLNEIRQAHRQSFRHSKRHGRACPAISLRDARLPPSGSRRSRMTTKRSAIKTALTALRHLGRHGHPSPPPHHPDRARSLSVRRGLYRLFRGQRLHRRARLARAEGPRPALARMQASWRGSRPSTPCGSGACRCCAPTRSTPTCWTSAPARCSAAPTGAI